MGQTIYTEKSSNEWFVKDDLIHMAISRFKNDAKKDKVCTRSIKVDINYVDHIIEVSGLVSKHECVHLPEYKLMGDHWHYHRKYMFERRAGILDMIYKYKFKN